MPASASTQPAGPPASSRPPHANGPSRLLPQQSHPGHSHRAHKTSLSADASDPRSTQTLPKHHNMLSKDLPEPPRPYKISRPTQETEAERYKRSSIQKLGDVESTSSQGHGSSSQHGHTYSYSQAHGHGYGQHALHPSASHSSHNSTSASSLGRNRSATVAGTFGNQLNTSTSSSSSAQGHGRSKIRRKQPDATEQAAAQLGWDNGSEPMVLSPTDPDMQGSGRSRNRHTGLYRDAPGSATMGEIPIAMNKNTLSRATGASAASSTKTLGQPTYILADGRQPGSASLGRHHHSASASMAVGSSRTTVQQFANSNTNPDRIVYRPQANESGNGSASSNTPTPKASHGFVGSTTPTAAAHSHALKHANAHNARALPLTISANEASMNATAPAGISTFAQQHSSSDEQRKRKVSHRRTASASTHGVSMSPSSESTGTGEGSSHCDGDADAENSDLWKSGTSLSQMSASHASMGRFAGGGGPPLYQQQQQQSSTSQYRRPRGVSDASALQPAIYPGAAPVVVPLDRRGKDGRSRPGTATGTRGGGEGEERGRTKEKGLMGRVRERSNSLTKPLINAMKSFIDYPKHLKSKRESKQNLGDSASSGHLAYSEGRGDSFDNAYTPSSTSGSTASHNSPIYTRDPHRHQPPQTQEQTGRTRSKSSVNVIPTRERKRSHSAQPQPRQPRVITRKDRERMDLNRMSPMTTAKHHVLADFEGVDLPQRVSGVGFMQVQISQSKISSGQSPTGITFPSRGDSNSRAPAIPLMGQELRPRRR